MTAGHHRSTRLLFRRHRIDPPVRKRRGGLDAHGRSLSFRKVRGTPGVRTYLTVVINQKKKKSVPIIQTDVWDSSFKLGVGVMRLGKKHVENQYGFSVPDLFGRCMRGKKANRIKSSNRHAAPCRPPR